MINDTNQLDLYIIIIIITIKIIIIFGSSTFKLYETVDPSVANINIALDFMFMYLSKNIQYVYYTSI